ncbi:MAG: pilus assembly protein PilP [Syntrophaceae bacterium]|nr:pilus assembly protein PilP [Syntrophaceae bacterium]
MSKNRFLSGKEKGSQENRTLYSLLSLWAVFLFMVASCGGSSPPPVQKAKPLAVEKKMAESAKAPEKKDQEEKKEPEYVYNPAGKPDPFKPFIQLESVKEVAKTAPLTPLQKYDVSQLKLVAIITSAEGGIAMVEDATGKGYSLRKGTGIGKHDGKVKKILKDRVIIEEVYEDTLGQKKVHEISLFLHKEGGES